MDDRDENPFVVTSNRVRYHARPWSGEFSYHVRRFLSFFLLKIDTHFFLLSFFFSFTVSLLVSFPSIFFFFFPLPRSFSFFPLSSDFLPLFFFSILLLDFLFFVSCLLLPFFSLFRFPPCFPFHLFYFLLSFSRFPPAFAFLLFFFVFLRFPAFLSFPLSPFSRIKLRFRLLAPAKSFRKRERMFSRTNRSGTTPWRVER